MIGNQIKTVLLLGILTGILLLAGQIIGGMTGLIVAFAFALVLNLSMYWFSDKIVLSMYHAREADANSELRSVVKEVSEKAGLPMPRVYIIPTENPNAFATGRDPSHAAVAATEGILHLLTREELSGVIAHEMSHVRNRDTLVQTIAVTIAGAIGFLASMARFGALFGGYSGRDDRGSNFLEMLVLAILTPIIATLIQLAISRSREYLADETGAKIVHDSKGLASALVKIDRGIKRNPLDFGSRTSSSLFIENPFRGSAVLELFSTHPPVEKRVERLNELNF